MYKIFFNDRNIFLTDDFTRTFQVKYGLFYKFRDIDELAELLDFYRNLKKIENLFVFHTDIEELQKAFRSCFHNVEAAGGVVRNSKGQVLVMFRRGKWDLPKGKLDAGESHERAALREISEECGIKELTLGSRMITTYHSYILDNQKILKRTLWFEIHYTGLAEPVPQQKEEISEIRWFDPESLDLIISNTYNAVLDVLKYAHLIRL
jgi:8-oxo-dGTP pyrophosphatase MutT (NUDIX family)